MSEQLNNYREELFLCEGVTVETRLGATPVEYTGKVDHKEYYFRSRGQQWEMIIGDTVDQCVEASLTTDPLAHAEFYCTGRYGKEQFDAGYMPLEQAESIIGLCVEAWRNAQVEVAKSDTEK